MGITEHKHKVPRCPWCKTPVNPAKKRFDGFSGGGCLAGDCACGAIYVIDENGKGGGTAIMDGLVFLAGGDTARALTLQKDVDYEMRIKPWRLVGEKRSVQKRASYGQPKLWFFILNAQPPQDPL